MVTLQSQLPDLHTLKPVSEFTSKLNLATSTGIRWCLRGVRAGKGKLTKLRSVRIGRTLHTTDEWFAEFINVASATELDMSRTPAERQRASEAAGAELERIGA